MAITGFVMLLANQGVGEGHPVAKVSAGEPVVDEREQLEVHVSVKADEIVESRATPSPMRAV